VPIGVVGIIFESRPNVTSDCLGLCLKSGNAAILKGGKEAFFSNQAIFNILQRSMAKAKIPRESFYLISSADRASLKTLLKLNDYVDVIIPRGGESLIQFVAKNSSVPVIKHYKGVCHVYVSASADLTMAEEICFNAKVQRPGVCNAMETMLVDQKIAKNFLPIMINRLQASGVKIKGCSQTRKIFPRHVTSATEHDWYEEYLDLVLSVKVVKNLNQAIEHINTYGSGHSDAIVTEKKNQARLFLEAVDSACVYVNASTRFTDGYEFGFGAEVGISTDKLHARGPMALSELTTYHYRIHGKGQVRQ
jgi:glutamate-5-semialdehyde dehydrogenase